MNVDGHDMNVVVVVELLVNVAAVCYGGGDCEKHGVVVGLSLDEIVEC